MTRNRENQLNLQKKWAAEKYAAVMGQIIDVLGGRCIVCGSTNSLQCDHVDPRTKLFAIGSGWTRPAEELWLEVAKCQLLCRPHHEQKTAVDGSNNNGEINGMSKLREIDVRYIRGLYELGHSQRAIAAEFEVSHSSVGDILRGNTWTHVK